VRLIRTRRRRHPVAFFALLFCDCGGKPNRREERGFFAGDGGLGQ
jgi:hypothetical protein